MATLSDFITKLRAKTGKRLLKVEFLDADENVLTEITPKVIDGDVQKSDESGARRNANIIFDNEDNTFLPDPDGYIWMNNKFRISTGLVMDDGSDYWISQGIFICGEPEVVSELADNEVSVQFLDKFALLNGEQGGTLDVTYKGTAGESILDAVQDILVLAGEVKPLISEPTTEVLPYELVFEAGATYGEMLIKLADMISWVFYFDSDGYPRFEPPASLDITGSSWDFSTTEITYLGSRHRYEFTNVYNYVVVIGDSINDITVRAFAQDNSATSPTGIPKIGKKTLVINDDLIYTTALAQYRADRELQKAVSLVETTDVTCMPIDILEGGQIVTITDSSSGLNEDRFLIKSISLPLTIDGEMSITAWQGRVLEEV